MTLTEDDGLPIGQWFTGTWQAGTVETTTFSQVLVGGEAALMLNTWPPPPATDTVNT